MNVQIPLPGKVCQLLSLPWKHIPAETTNRTAGSVAIPSLMLAAQMLRKLINKDLELKLLNIARD